MIAFLRGKIINKGAGFVVLRTGDIGYKVRVNATQYVELDINQETEFYIYHHVREDAQELFGFNDMESLEMFELLLSISGIGPKSAINTLAIASVGELKESIAHGDPTLLNKVSGIGKKTAERIVLELRDKVAYIDSMSGGEKSFGGATGDEIDALMALGYSLQQARESLKAIDPKIKDSGERIRAALKGLGK